MKEEKKDTRMTRGMTVFYLLLTLVGGIIVVWKVADIQFGTHTYVDGDGDTVNYTWREKGEKREIDLDTDTARRGNIYSSDGKILATTVKECDFCLDFGSMVDSNYNKYLDTVCLLLHRSFPWKGVDYYKNRIDSEHRKAQPSRCFSVERSVPYSTWQAIRSLPGWKRGVVKEKSEKVIDKETGKYKTVKKSVIKQKRAFIYGNMALNTIGFHNSESVDTYTGLEGAYDSILRGQDGKFYRRRLTRGLWLPDEPRGRKEVVQRRGDDEEDTVVVQRKVDGQSIISTIDTRYQDIAENALRKALHQHAGTSGCAILMEMETGYVLACANLMLDTTVHDFLERRDKNVAVSHVYEPGSTFKTIIMTAMMEDREIKIDTAMKVKAVYKDFGGKNGEIKDSHRKNDSLSVKEVMEESSNVGMCDLGWKYYNHRRDKLVELVRNIFPYERLHLDVKADEYDTKINNVNVSNRDFLNFCYGYSTIVSAMRLITFYNALGAGGRMVKPLFCRGIMEGDKVREMKPVVLKEHVCSKETAAMMKSLLEGVVENGTGNNIKNNTYGIAGKTGTAVHSYDNKSRYNSSFAGFFPSENPRYTCLVVIENSPAYGRQAAIVFKAISDCVVAVDKRLSDGAVKSAWPTLEADSGKVQQRPVLEKGNQEEIERVYKILSLPYSTADPDSKWVYYRTANDSIPGGYKAFRPEKNKVPNCYGMSAKDAVNLLQSMGYRVRVSGYGKVVSQEPRHGSAAKKGTMVTLTLK